MCGHIRFIQEEMELVLQSSKELEQFGDWRRGLNDIHHTWFNHL